MRTPAAVLGLVALTSCAVGPDFTRPTMTATNSPYLPKNLTLPANLLPGGAQRSDWWRAFGSPQLDELVARAVAENQDLKAAQATLAGVRAREDATAGISYPQVGFHAGAEREKVNFASYGLNFPSATLNLFSIGTSVSYALDIFGHDRRLKESAGAAAEAERYRVNGAYLALTGNVVIQAMTAAALRDEIEVATALVEADKVQLGLVNGQHAAGAIGEVPLAEAEEQLANDASMLPALRSQLAAANDTLSLLSGMTPGQWTPPDASLASFSDPRGIALTVPSELVRQRPDIMAAEADLHRASADVGVATANRYPRVVLTADFTQWALNPGQLWRDAASSTMVGGGLTAPLFQGGELAAEQRAAKAGYDASLARYRQTVLQSFAQVATVLETLAQDHDARRETEHGLAAAERLTWISALRNRQGTLGRLPLLASQRRELIAKRAVIQARAQQLKDSAELMLATGAGGTPSPQDRSTLMAER